MNQEDGSGNVRLNDRLGGPLVPFDTHWEMVQACDKLRLDRDQMKALLGRWLEFASDVQPGCAAGADWLDELRTKTRRFTEDA